MTELSTEEKALSNEVLNELDISIEKMFKIKGISELTGAWFSLLQTGVNQDGTLFLNFNINNWVLPNPDDSTDFKFNGRVEIEINATVFQWSELRALDKAVGIANKQISWKEAIKLRILYIIWKAYDTYCDIKEIKRFKPFWRRLYDTSTWLPIFRMKEDGELDADWKKL